VQWHVEDTLGAIDGARWKTGFSWPETLQG